MPRVIREPLHIAALAEVPEPDLADEGYKTLFKVWRLHCTTARVRDVVCAHGAGCVDCAKTSQVRTSSWSVDRKHVSWCRQKPACDVRRVYKHAMVPQKHRGHGYVSEYRGHRHGVIVVVVQKRAVTSRIICCVRSSNMLELPCRARCMRSLLKICRSQTVHVSPVCASLWRDQRSPSNVRRHSTNTARNGLTFRTDPR